MTDRIKSALIYMTKCAAGVLLVYLLAASVHYTDIGWCLISVMLVLSPDGKDAVTLAMTRIKANLAGAGIGVLSLWIAPGNMWSISIAVAITVLICELLKLSAGTRSALAATIIIMLHEEGKHVWDTALERIISVLAGCILGMIITFLFHFRIKQGNNNTVQQQEA